MRLLIIIIVAIVSYIIFLKPMAKNYYFICNSCNNRFKVSPIKMATTTTVPNFYKHKLKCPFCGNKNYMKQIKEE
ncbi:hypothetical protein KPL37_13640 [Clostridium frigoris]|uniref:Uncharacterized protein n=1 Tax=Clostridium frigoris TaxID=205327 RepID=A0ABS6BWV4_9CLOT|nr:hypothetical protein [Clostridium frigoris]MBU3160783.1 hypothetical protein [Clostridium frigoris]